MLRYCSWCDRVHDGACRERERRRGTPDERGYGMAWRLLRERQLRRQWYCARCGATSDLTVDHIVPKSCGGRDVLHNLQTLCRSCNSTKGAGGGGASTEMRAKIPRASIRRNSHRFSKNELR